MQHFEERPETDMLESLGNDVFFRRFNRSIENLIVKCFILGELPTE